MVRSAMEERDCEDRPVHGQAVHVWYTPAAIHILATACACAATDHIARLLAVDNAAPIPCPAAPLLLLLLLLLL
jgi:hypothetical protein